MATFPTSVSEFRRVARRTPRVMARTLGAFASGRNLLAEVDQLREKAQRLELQHQRVEVQYMRVITTLIRRHYLDAAVPPAELRLHVGAQDSVLNFWAKGIGSSDLVLEAFGEEPPGRMLDWGCGSGRTLFWLRAYPGWRANYHGTDVDEAAVAFLEEQGEERVVACKDDPPLPFPDGHFAGIFSFSVLTHIPPENHPGWWQEVRRVLQPGGLALITTDSRMSDVPAELAAEFRRSGTAFATGPGHYKHLSRVSEEFTRQAIGTTLTVEEFRPRGYLGQDVILARRPADPD
jgi:SAM-dependent methyltransferase